MRFDLYYQLTLLGPDGVTHPTLVCVSAWKHGLMKTRGLWRSESFDSWRTDHINLQGLACCRRCLTRKMRLATFRLSGILRRAEVFVLRICAGVWAVRASSRAITFRNDGETLTFFGLSGAGVSRLDTGSKIRSLVTGGVIGTEAIVSVKLSSVSSGIGDGVTVFVLRRRPTTPKKT